MKTGVETGKSNISQLPLGMLIKEGESQKERVAAEVMEALFARLPNDVQRDHDFELSDGTKCWIKKFHPPRKSEEDGWIYGFDVKFSPESPLTHLEFSVRCSGWERSR